MIYIFVDEMLKQILHIILLLEVLMISIPHSISLEGHSRDTMDYQLSCFSFSHLDNSKENNEVNADVLMVQNVKDFTLELFEEILEEEEDIKKRQKVKLGFCDSNPFYASFLRLQPLHHNTNTFCDYYVQYNTVALYIQLEVFRI